MTSVRIEPTSIHPIPYDADDEIPDTFFDEVRILGDTAELQVGMGAALEVSKDTAEQEKQLLIEALKSKNPNRLQNTNTAFAAAAFLRTYGAQLALDVAAARAAITNKLMELANCGDAKIELRALELLGKHSDIGLFTERSEVTINYKTPEALEEAIKTRIKRLLNADLIDITPLAKSLDEEFGPSEIDEEISAHVDPATSATPTSLTGELVGE